ncbi:gliding motility-associated C-terminal domain-containing protein [Flagellimonas okinawensis]|uniref:Gliding motility-associated C-terminal domain-containing protein n=1 Tax=Flagellimonas okinawensis TaxID=3031324 RepID=A0ABT5XPD1_9FLAO|nr:gliding motility-associated C-terminal domain-containing protein [[Muricauda] okinawensis]MDF0707753.1 gliding motility-associated C-terminal domain-containing protein [[Muricauda] okinawensis]
MNKPQTSFFIRFFLLMVFLVLASVQKGYAQDCAVNAGPDQTISQVTSVFMDADTPPVGGSGTWSRLSGPTSVNFDDINDPQTQLLDLVPGDYVFEWTVSGPSCDTASDLVGITVEAIDLEIEIVSSNAVPDIGEEVTFTVNISNFGDIGATNVVLDYFVPSGYNNITAIDNSGSVDGSQKITWFGFNVPVGSNTVSLSFNATVLTPTGTIGEYIHVAEIIFAAQIDTDSTPNNDDGDQSEDDEGNIEAAPVQADLSLNKSIVGGDLSPFVGEQASFEITVSNSGPHDAANVQVEDQLLSGFSFDSYSATTGTYDPITGIWNVGTVSNSAMETLTIVVDINPTGNYSNTAQITASDAFDIDSTPNNDNLIEDDQDDILLTPQPVIDLSLTKTIDKSPPLVSDNVRFTLTVTNAGPSDATNVEVTDLLPSGYTYVSDDSGGSYNENTGVWNVGSLVNGESISLSILCNVNASGDYDNIAEITGHDQTDIDSAPNNNAPGEDDQDGVSVVPEPLVDIAVSKTVDQFIPEVGEEILFTVTVQNDGPSDATNVVVTDVLATGYRLINATPSNGTYNGNNGSWVVGDLANGASETLEIAVEVLSAGNYSNTAELTNVSEQDSDSTPNNNNESEDDQQTIEPVVIPVADLLLRKSVNILSPYVGQEVIFTINITNLGPSDATGVEVMDLLPDGYTYVSHGTTAGIYSPTTGMWTLNGDMADVSTETLTIVAEVNNTGDYFNVTEVFASDQYDPNSIPNNNNVFENDQDNAGTTPIPSADLNLDISVDNATPDVGSEVTFTIVLLNEGPSDAIGIEVENRLPNGFTYVSDDSGGVFNPSNGIWNVGNLALGSQTELRIVAEVNPSGNYMVTTEVVDATFFDVDSTPDNSIVSEDDQDELTVLPRQVTDISVNKTINDMNPEVGDEVVFTIEVNNNGPNDASGLIIEDELENGYQFVSAITSAGLYDEIAGSWDLPSVSNGATETLTIRAIVLSSGEYQNTAELTALDTYDPDSTPNNNLGSEDDQATVIPVPGGLNDLSLSKTVDNGNPNVGDVVRFVISVTNNGPSDARNVEVTDRLPAGYTYESHSSTAGVYNPVSGVWNVNRTILNQDSESLEILAVVNPPIGAEDEYLNKTFISSSLYADPDSDPSTGIGEDDFADGIADDDEATAFVVPQVADIAITKSVNNVAPNIGDEVVFDITVTNQGTDDATHIGVQEELPLGYRFISAEVSMGTFDTEASFWEIESLAISETATLSLTVEVLDIEDYINRVGLVYMDQWDSNENNNSDEAFVEPSCLVVYNEFSPNGDGVNDFFKIDCISRYPGNTLQIYNRWGNIVYQTKSYNNDWDGTPNGRAMVQPEDQLPVGTYYYVLDLGDGSEPRTDWLYLNR